MPQPPYHHPGQVPPAGWYGLDPNDPLVTPPGVGINGWNSRVVGSLRRSWRPLLIILGITQAVPAVILGLISNGYTDTLVSPQAETGQLTPAEAQAEMSSALADLGAFLVVALIAVVVLGLLQSAGYAAATWVMVREAAGQPARLGNAFGFGARRMAGLWGWSLAVGVIVTFGLCLCVLPGIYFVFAFSLFGTVYLFERGNSPLGRSWRMVHANVGAVLGRMALLAAVVVGSQLLISVLEVVVLGALGIEQGLHPVAVVVTVVGILATLPAVLVMAVGIVLTYAEQRAGEAPVNTAVLAGELT